MIKRLTIEIDEKIRNKAKSMAAMEGKSIKDLITELILQYTGS